MRIKYNKKNRNEYFTLRFKSIILIIILSLYSFSNYLNDNNHSGLFMFNYTPHELIEQKANIHINFEIEYDNRHMNLSLTT